MTVIANPSRIIGKHIIVHPPKVEFIGANDKQFIEEAKVDVHPEWVRHSHSSGACCVLLCSLLLVLLGCGAGMMCYQQLMHRPAPRRYTGFCSVPIAKDVRVDNYRMLPLRWSADSRVQVVSALEEAAGDDFESALREELDLGDGVEKISVINNGRRVNFIHDFNDNTTGIVDDERCFIMDLEPELVMSPELFIAGLQTGGQFDVSRVRSNVRAALPALVELSRAASELAAKCLERPVYRLYRDDGVVIRKRSVDDPEHDYIQFSGKHVLELKIDNLPEVLAYENTVKGI